MGEVLSVLSSCTSHWVTLVYGRASPSGSVRWTGQGLFECVCVCCIFLQSSWSVCSSAVRSLFLVLFPVATAPQLMLGNSKVESFDSGPLEAECAASPKGPGLPTTGAMRDFPTTLTGDDGGSRAALVGSSRTLPCDVSR